MHFHRMFNYSYKYFAIEYVCSMLQQRTQGVKSGCGERERDDILCEMRLIVFTTPSMMMMPLLVLLQWQLAVFMYST